MREVERARSKVWRPERAYQTINVKDGEIRARIPMRNHGFIRHLILPHVVDSRGLFFHLLRNRRMIGRFVFPELGHRNAHQGVIGIQWRQVQRCDIVEHEIASSTGIELV